MSGYVLYSIAGVLISAVPALLPGMHIAFIISIMALVLEWVGISDAHAIVAFMAGSVVGYLFFSNVPAVWLSAPDDSSVLISRHGYRMLAKGKGHEAVALAVLGGLVGLLAVCVFILPFVYDMGFHAKMIKLNFRWMLWSVLVLLFLVLLSGEDSKRIQGQSYISAIVAGLLTITLSAIIGHAALGAGRFTFNTCFMPLVAGLFAAPSLLLNSIFGTPTPDVNCKIRNIRWGLLSKASFSGLISGLLASAIPFGNAGISGLFTAKFQKDDDRVILVAQGAARSVYYVTGILLFMIPDWPVPCLPMMAMPVCITNLRGEPVFFLGACIMISAVIAVAVLFLFLARSRLFSLLQIRRICRICLIGLIMVVWSFAGTSGLAIFIVATAIGMIPPLFGLSRIYCIAGLIVPLL